MRNHNHLINLIFLDGYILHSVDPGHRPLLLPKHVAEHGTGHVTPQQTRFSLQLPLEMGRFSLSQELALKHPPEHVCSWA